MLRSAVVVVAVSLSLTACSHGPGDYSAEKTWRCLSKQGLTVRLESSPDLMPGTGALVTFQRLARTPNDAVASGGFAFVRKGSNAEDVKRRFVRNQQPAGFNQPGVSFGETNRNVVPWWSDTADSKFKASAEDCLS